MTLTQEQQVLELSKKDLSQFAIFYNEYGHDVYRYVYSKIRNREQTEDIVSSVFMKAMEKIGAYKFQGKTIKCWLFTIARNQVFEMYSKKTLTSLDEMEDDASVAQEDTILETLVDEQLSESLMKELSTLSPEIQEIIRMRIWDELPFDEIALILEKRLQTVKMAYYRGLEKLKAKANKNVSVDGEKLMQNQLQFHSRASV